jgi:hypothetical protein
MRGCRRPILRDARTRDLICGTSAARALLRMRRLKRIPSPRLVAEPFSVIPISRCQTAHLVPAARFCARGLQLCFTHPESRGGRSAEKRSGATAPVRHAVTRRTRRLARRLASHDAGRSPLGAPPWRFWAPGAALPSPWAPAVLQRRAGALRIRAASSSHPGRSAWRAGSLPPEASGYKPPPQDATPRLQDVSGDAPR